STFATSGDYESLVGVTRPEDSKSSPPTTLLASNLADVPATRAAWSSKRASKIHANENTSPSVVALSEELFKRIPVYSRKNMGSQNQENFQDITLRTKARFDDQAALVAGTSARLEANKVVGGDDLESSESTYDNDAQDQVSELEMKVFVDGKQEEAKVVKFVVMVVE
nr:hypothetical protein [Tanacetum cinerariifolium]